MHILDNATYKTETIPTLIEDNIYT